MKCSQVVVFCYSCDKSLLSLEFFFSLTNCILEAKRLYMVFMLKLPRGFVKILNPGTLKFIAYKCSMLLLLLSLSWFLPEWNCFNCDNDKPWNRWNVIYEVCVRTVGWLSPPVLIHITGKECTKPSESVKRRLQANSGLLLNPKSKII